MTDTDTPTYEPPIDPDASSFRSRTPLSAWAVVRIDAEEKASRSHNIAGVFPTAKEAEEAACWAVVEDALEEARAEIEDNETPPEERLGFYGWLSEQLDTTDTWYQVDEARFYAAPSPPVIEPT